MFNAAIEHASNAIETAVLQTQPYDHLHIRGVFPDEFFQTLLANLPALHEYQRLVDTKRVSPNYNPERYCLQPGTSDVASLNEGKRQFWTEFFHALEGDRMTIAVLNKFSGTLKRRFGGDPRYHGSDLDISWSSMLMRDRGSYNLGPHTDQPTKVAALLFYLPPSAAAPHLGTSLYEPKSPNITIEDNGQHLQFDDFNRLSTIPFEPNTLFAFAKTHDSFHGVEPVEDGLERDLLLFDVRHTLPPARV
jgi:hypothetical protein